MQIEIKKNYLETLILVHYFKKRDNFINFLFAIPKNRLKISVCLKNFFGLTSFIRKKIEKTTVLPNFESKFRRIETGSSLALLL